MNLAVGALLLVTGTLIILAGIALVVGEIITGRHRASDARTMVAADWTGAAAVLSGIAAIFQALKDWPPPALLILLGLIADGVGIWILSARPITA